MRYYNVIIIRVLFVIFVGCDLEELLKTAETLKIERASEVLQEMLEDRNDMDGQEMEESEISMYVLW